MDALANAGLKVGDVVLDAGVLMPSLTAAMPITRRHRGVRPAGPTHIGRRVGGLGTLREVARQVEDHALFGRLNRNFAVQIPDDVLQF